VGGNAAINGGLSIAHCTGRKKRKEKKKKGGWTFFLTMIFFMKNIRMYLD
jgi:hypothetical protein